MKLKSSFLFLGFLVGFSACSCFADTPRFKTLKHETVNLRTGPGIKYPVKWVYKQKRYPVEIKDRHDLWYLVEEVDGTTGWIHEAMLSNAKYGLIVEEGELLECPNPECRKIAIVQTGTLGKIEDCKEISCLIEFSYRGEEVRGWYKKKDIYGVEEKE